MTIQALSWVLEESVAEGSGRLVLIVLANHYSRAGICFVSYETIAREARIARSTAIKVVGELEAAGHIEVRRVERPGRASVNRYRLCFPQPVDGRETSVRESDPFSDKGSDLDAERVRSGSVKGPRIGPEPKENQELTARGLVVEHLDPDARERAKAELRKIKGRLRGDGPQGESDEPVEA